jgi:hypothetical protein
VRVHGSSIGAAFVGARGGQTGQDRSMKITHLVAPLLVSLVLAACGDDGGSITGLAGIYTIDTWTHNTAGCDAEGEPETGHEANLYIESEDFLGHAFVNANTCTDVADCQSQIDSDTLDLGRWILDGGSDSAGWTGKVSYAGGDGATGCSGGVITVVLTSPAAGKVRFETRSQSAAPFAVDSNGECTTEAAEAAAVDQPCESLEVTTATLVE